MLTITPFGTKMFAITLTCVDLWIWILLFRTITHRKYQQKKLELNLTARLKCVASLAATWRNMSKNSLTKIFTAEKSGTKSFSNSKYLPEMLRFCSHYVHNAQPEHRHMQWVVNGYVNDVQCCCTVASVQQALSQISHDVILASALCIK